MITLTLKKTWSVETMGRYNGFLSLKVNTLSVPSALFYWHAILLQLSVKENWTSMKCHVLICDRFSSFLTLYQSLSELAISCKDWILTKKTAAWECTTSSIYRKELNSCGEFLCKHITNEKGCGYQNDQLLKVIISCTFQKHCKTYPPHLQFQYNNGTL